MIDGCASEGLADRLHFNWRVGMTSWCVLVSGIESNITVQPLPFNCTALHRLVNSSHQIVGVAGLCAVA
jgi:hypothetical protein